ncbi:hypothetical protein [Aestuariivivens marinum]|uniref:hypothetical protein n=1 Tax=Aestuariivivens marinum TaxID=2913555 RepID=UPI001F571839|nr:hypothetical protein [Aestuariivivens marinum]
MSSSTAKYWISHEIELRVSSRNLVYLFFIIALLSILNANSQDKDSVPDLLVSKLEAVSKNKAIESVYLQTSKGIYETGEDLWFKGYVLDSRYLTLSEKSKTLYVQLIEDISKKPVWEERYEIEYGFVDGHIYVHDSLQDGNYTLAAYTPHSFFNDGQPIKSVRQLRIAKNITSYHQTKKDTVPTEESKGEKIDFQLFPEGGHLVSGIQSKVAFKAVNANGSPKTVSGTLFENNISIKTFKTTHAGMGTFTFTPVKGNHYHIELDSLTTKKPYGIPDIKSKGQVLQLVGHTKDNVTFKVSKHTADKETVYLRVQVRGVVYSIARAEVEKERLIKIHLKDMPQGIAEVTLFNKDLEPTAERLVYVNHDQRLNIKTILDKGEYLTKDKVQLKLKVTDQNNQPIVAHLGLSVFDRAYQNLKDGKTIETHYHLSTQLKGKLYNPGYYFNEKNKNRKEALDVLLLAQGWRAYEWAEPNLIQEREKTHPVLNDTVTGKLYAKNKKAQGILTDQYVMAFTADNESAKMFIDVDALGRFKVLPEHLQQAKRGYLYLKPLLNDPKAKKDITIEDPSFARINGLIKQKPFGYSQTFNEEFQIKIDLRPFVVANDVNKLDEVVVSGKKQRVFRDKYMGTLDSLAKLDINPDYVCINNILNCRNHVFDNRNKKPVVGEKYISFNGLSTYHSPPKFELSEEELLKKFNLVRIKGYYGKKEFYAPVYDALEQVDGFPDYRNTLYWKPDMITNEKGEAEIEFYTSDINTGFIGIVEGVSGNGQLGRQTFEFRVRKREQ